MPKPPFRSLCDAEAAALAAVAAVVLKQWRTPGELARQPRLEGLHLGCA